MDWVQINRGPVCKGTVPVQHLLSKAALQDADKYK